MSAPAVFEAEKMKREKRWQEQHQAVNQNSDDALFQTRPLTRWLNEAATRPPARRLAGPLLTEGELTLGFADTGIGKTAFGVQLGNDFARGKSSTGLPLETEGQRTLLIDFELSDAQHLSRYASSIRTSGYTDVFQFSENFIRAEIAAASVRRKFDAAKWHEILLDEIERVILESEARVVIVDNITYLSPESEKQKPALALMLALNEIKKRPPGCSMLVWAHTPKRKEELPISINDLAGSKILANFADSIFGIGRSCSDPSQRYIKQLKVRSGELVYSANNVALFRFEKPDNFLGFTYMGQDREVDHLKSIADTERGERMIKARSMKEGGMSQREIASALNVSLGTVNKDLKRVGEFNTDTDTDEGFIPANCPNNEDSISNYLER